MNNDMNVNGEKYSLTPGRAVRLYTATFVATYTSDAASKATYSGTGLAAMDVWDIDYASYNRQVPMTCTLTTAEQSSITNEQSDVISYGQEMILKFLTGTEKLTDETWDAYVQSMKNFGIDHCLEVWQTAYENYLAELPD